jgi:30S ribosomal protein S31
MGKGDKKSKKGKISMGSFGVSRPRKRPAFDAAAVVAPLPKAEKAPVATKASKKKAA